MVAKFLKSRMMIVSSMRIAHVAPIIYPVPPETYGGTERVVADLARAQIGAGDTVAVFGPADGALNGVEFIGDYRSVSWHAAKAGQDMPPGFPAELEALQLRDLLREADRFDVLHLHGSAHASGVAAMFGKPVFRTVHWRADEADHALHFETFPEERVIAISQRQARDVPAGSLAGVVHHGIPLDRYKLQDTPREYLAFIGRMTDQKRPDRAIELGMHIGLPVKLAGPVDPGNPAYFERTVAPLLGPGAVHVGGIDDARKQDFLSSARALVFPIDWPEPFGLVMIEAMACGTPVIAWDRGSVPEIVEDGVTGLVVSSLEEAATRFASAMALDPKDIRRRFEERFSSARMAREIRGLYTSAFG